MNERFPGVSHKVEREANRGFISEASPVRSGQIPPGYALFTRQVMLLNGKKEPAFYSTHEQQTPLEDAWEKSSGSIIAGIAWALTTESFADNETEDDDRTQEIGNMMSYGISQGLTESQLVECYRIAFSFAKK